MGTSLADQLKKLSLPQTNLLLQDKKRASLLFDPKEAANLDRETFYELGLEGLEELKKFDSRFTNFDSTLFNVLSKTLERSVESSAANKKLDEDIKRFIFLLSPYFLVKCSHKTLEWLIYRFHIHQFNVDELLMLILPYHETRMFVRVLQLIDVKDPVNRWHWLRPLQKPGVPLSKLALLNHCASDNSFLQFVCNMTMQAVKVHGENANSLSTLFSFCCTTLSGALEFSKNISEIQVNCILKLLLKGITFSAVDFSAASLMIAAQLARKTHLSNNIVISIINKISKNPHESLHMECVILLVLLYETQKETLSSFPLKSLMRLIKFPKFIPALNHIASSGGNLMPLLIPLLSTTLKNIQSITDDQEALKSFAEKVLTKLTLDKKGAERVIRTVIDMFDDDMLQPTNKKNLSISLSTNSKKAVVEWYSSYLSQLERQYSTTFDLIALQSLQGAETTEHKEALRCILGFMPRIAHRVGSTDVFEKLHHNKEGMRVEAIKYLVSHYKKLKEQDKQLLLEGLKERLLDESHEVITAVMDFPAPVLASLVGTEFLIDQLIILARRFWYLRSTALTLTNKILKYLCSDMSLLINEKHPSILLTVLPYLLPSENNDVQSAMVILQSVFGKQNTLIKAVIGDLGDLTNKPTAADLSSVVFKKMTDSKCLPDFNVLIETINKTPQAKEEPIYQFLTTILLTTAVCKDATVQQIWNLLDTTLDHVYSPKVVLVQGGTSLSGEIIPSCMASLIHKELPLQVLMYMLSTLINHISLPEELKGCTWWDLTVVNSYTEKTASLLLTRLFEVLINGCSLTVQDMKHAYITVLNQFFQANFPSLQNQLGFLCNLWVSHELEGRVDYELQLRSLLLGTALLRHSKLPVGWASSFGTMSIVPALLVSVTCPMAPIREAAMKCFAVIGRSFSASLDKNSYICLVEELLKREEELKMDAEQISIIMYTLLSPDSTVQSLLKRSQKVPLKNIRDALLQCILDEATPVYVCSALLRIMAYVNSNDILLKLVPLGERVLSWSKKQENQLKYYRSAIFRNIMSRLNQDSSKALEQNDCWKFFKSVLLDYKTIVLSEDGKTTYPAVLAMDQISKEVFESVPSRQQNLLAVLVSVGTATDSPEVVSAVGRVFKRIILDSQLVVVELEKMQNAGKVPESVTSGTGLSVLKSTESSSQLNLNTSKSPATRAASKSRSVCATSSLKLMKSIQWRQGVTLLELIQDKKKLHNVQFLLPVLSGILQRCLDFEEQAPVEYIKQLVLSCILHCCQILTSESERTNKPPRALNVELVVECIRGTQNPQTHHHALLVLSQMAEMIPERVLHNIMAIFIFMGSCILRQDDGYSFQVISKIVETVIPVIVKATDMGMLPQQQHDVTVSVLRVFADALLDVPEYRRLALFYKLMSTMDARSFLWVLICLVLEKQIRTGNKDQAKRQEFLLDITMKYSPDIVIQNCVNLLEYLRSLPINKDNVNGQQKYHERVNKMPNSSVVKAVAELFLMDRYTDKQLRHFKYLITTYLSSVLSSHQFISKVAELSEEDTNQLVTSYRTLIENILHYIQSTSLEAEHNSNQPTAKYWKVMLHHGYDILDRVNALLPSDMFLLVIRGLLDNEIPTVRRKAMDLFNAQLQRPEFFTSCNHDDLLTLLVPLMNIITRISSQEEDALVASQLNQQTALMSVKLLARLLAAENTTQFKKILDVLAELLAVNAPKGNVLASLVLCIAELCSALRAFSISSLPKVMPTLLSTLCKEKLTNSPDMVLLCIVSAVHKIVESLPHFLSPYMEKLLFEVCILSTKWQLEPDNQKVTPIVQKLKGIRQKISGLIPSRVLIPSLSKCYTLMIAEQHFSALGPLMDTLAESFTTMSGAEFSQLQSDLAAFFLPALQFRSDCTDSHVSQEEIFLAEGFVIQALVALVLKLSESSFRPLYYNLFHWSTSMDLHKDRMITFYRLSSSISECLKGLFVLFAGHFVKNAANMLDQNNVAKADTLFFGSGSDAEAKSKLLVEFVLKTLYNVFLYDSQNFLNKERFETLMQPIVDQLENTLGGMEALQSRAADLVTPCIAQFAVDVADDSLWKQLNYQILLKTRHQSACVRLIALETLCAMAHKLGEDFLPYLPETVPFLAELLEDEDENVEKACQKAVQDLEEVLGEPLRKYF